MRKFRFVGDPSSYDWDEKPVVGKVYPGTHKWHWIENDLESAPIELFFNAFPEDWKEVTETKTETVTKKPLHKDTDLGCFALELLKIRMQSRPMPFSNFDNDIIDSIDKAKELIKQLDNETDRH